MPVAHGPKAIRSAPFRPSPTQRVCSVQKTVRRLRLNRSGTVDWGSTRRARVSRSQFRGTTSKWRNRQTRQLEGLVPERAWGFKSPLRHTYFPSSDGVSTPKRCRRASGLQASDCSRRLERHHRGRVSEPLFLSYPTGILFCDSALALMAPGGGARVRMRIGCWSGRRRVSMALGARC